MVIDPDVFIWAVKCLNGEITKEMRMVVFQSNDRKFKFRYYLDCEANEFLRERAEVVAVNFDAGLPKAPIALDIEFVFTTEPLGQLDNLDGALFRRWENSSGDTTPEF